MLLMVQKKSPNEVPFFNGATYEFIPRLLVPRFIDSQKGISHAGNQMLSVNYGLIELEYVGSVSIGWGLITEAYANFGYLGVAGLAIFLAVYYSIFTRLTVGVPMTSLRFVLGLLALAAATAQDTMGIFVTSQFQGMVGVSLASFFLMRRQPNPFAQEQETGRADLVARVPRPGPSGAPAPGALASLIEGSSELKAEAPAMAGVASSNRTAMRPTAWMPRALRMRIITEQREQAALAAQATAAAPSNTGVNAANERPRQVAVPYRNYRRYRG